MDILAPKFDMPVAGAPIGAVDIPVAEPSIGEQEIYYVMQALRSGWVSGGNFVAQFEDQFARYCGVRYGVATSSGTAALHLALLALGIGPGDEVIVPAMTFVATANAVAYTGATPILVDVTPDYWCLDANQLRNKLSPRTKAIIPVHLYGHPCDMGMLHDVARTREIAVIEDAAEAHGAEYRGVRVGALSTVGCFSFYGNKIITTGEGGMCVTNDETLAERMRILRAHGMRPERKYWHEVVGYNYRLTNLQAALGVAQLGRIDQLIRHKRAIAGWYRDRLRDLQERNLLALHPEAHWAKCVYWMYSVLVRGRDGATRLRTELALKGVETRPFFVPVHRLPPYRSSAAFPVAERLSIEGVNLPSGAHVDERTIDRICALIRQCLA